MQKQLKKGSHKRLSKVGIIGDKDTVMGFLALGIDIFPGYSAEEIKKTFHKLAE